ncbi:hypothetical protein KJ359_011402 [Pestalotiopsis sp. 9143b]|nr:hypothetical protein KJ359_011402 [Pestalotiopsis sp. 9143b]
MHIHKKENEEKFRHLIAHCCDRKSNSGQLHLNADETAESLLKTFFDIIPCQYIIVDGLDECDKPVIKDTIRVLGSIVSQQDNIDPGKLRLLIVSRDMIEIRRPLSTENITANIFTIEAEDNDEAIKMYVNQRLVRLPPELKLNGNEVERIYKMTCDRAQGMFLFARLVLDNLIESVSHGSLLTKLEECHFPQNLGEAQGFYAFQDYAVSQWFYHIRDVVHISAQGLIDEQKSQTFANALDDFTNRYEESIDDMDSPPSSDASESSRIDAREVTKKASEECEHLKRSPFHPMLLNLWIHILKHQRKTTDDRNKPTLKEMEKTLLENRAVVEKLAEEADTIEEREALNEYYGRNLYKCPRTLCGLFYEGFDDAKKRKRHIDRHNRPFECTIPGCTMAEVGFISGKDLERHKKNYHSEVSSFPTLSKKSSEARFDCKICDKKFTRKINLDGHTRSHYGDRPFACQTCGKRFTRVNDLRRHEKLHLR